MLIYDIKISETASSGGWQKNTAKFDNVFLRQVVMTAATSTTTFNFTVTDDHGLIVYSTKNKATGTLQQEVKIPLKGIYTLAVSGSSADELFTGRFAVEE